MCPDCNTKSRAWTIVDLIRDYRTATDRLCCPSCRADAYVQRSSHLQERGAVWERWIKGVIPVTTDAPSFTPYVFLTAASPTGPVSALHFNYYKDTRSEVGGRLKHGHGPGGAPVLTKGEFLTLIGRLVIDGIFTHAEVMAAMPSQER